MKRYLLLWGIVVLSSLFLVSGAFAVTRCVNPAGSPPCYGSVGAAVAAAHPGDNISIFAGTYYENVYIPSAKGGLTIAGNGSTPGAVIIDAYPILRGLTITAYDPAFWIDGAPNVTIRNLTVRNDDSFGNIYSTGNNTTINTVNVLSGFAGGIIIYADNAMITKSLIANSDSNPIYIDGNLSVVTYNTINNNYDGVYLTGNAPFFANNTINVVYDDDCLDADAVDGGLFTANKISNCYDYGVEINATTTGGVSFTSNMVTTTDDPCAEFDVINSKIVSNNISACDGVGIYNDSTGGNTYANNVVKATESYGMEIYDNNPTITGNSVMNTMCEDGYYIDCYTTSTGGTIANNYSGFNGACEDYGFEIYVDNTTISGNLAEYNLEDGFYISTCTTGNNTITKNTARFNGYSEGGYGGFEIYGDGNTITLNSAVNNGGFGFYLGGNLTASGNTASNNNGTGMILSYSDGGTDTLSSNIVKNNVFEGIDNNATTGTVNITGNIVTGNRTDICESAVSVWSTFTGNTFNTGGKTTPCDL